MPKLTAKEVQALLAVPDHKVLAYGYTYDRRTVELYFEDGQLVRYEYTGDYEDPSYERSKHFEASYLTADLKRWYENSLCPKLLTFLETFGGSVQVTPGGKKHVWAEA